MAKITPLIMFASIIDVKEKEEIFVMKFKLVSKEEENKY